MADVFGIFIAATVLFALLAYLANREATYETITVIAFIAALFMGVFAWTAYQDHKSCEENPAYATSHREDC